MLTLGMPGVNTKAVKDRREVRLGSLAELRGEVDRLVAAAEAGQLRAAGNWTPGQIFGHLAAWASYPYEGFPMGPAPLAVRVAARLMKRRFLRGPLPAGVRIPKAADGTHATEAVALEEGAARLRRAIERLEKREPPRHASPVFGPMTVDEVTQGTLRHAELHLSFLHPGA